MARRDEFDLATQRAQRRRNRLPLAITAHYDPSSGRIVVGLSNELDVTFSPVRYKDWRKPRLRSSSPSRSRRLALAFIFQNWMRMFTCLPCSKVSWAPGAGSLLNWAPLAENPEARPRSQLRGTMAGWVADRRRPRPSAKLGPEPRQPLSFQLNRPLNVRFFITPKQFSGDLSHICK